MLSSRIYGPDGIAEQLGRPVDTVRGWLRAFTRSAQRILGVFTTMVHTGAPDTVKVWPAITGSTIADALGMLVAHARMLTGHHLDPGQDSVAATGRPIPAARGAEKDVLVGNMPWWSAGLAAIGPWLFSQGRWA